MVLNNYSTYTNSKEYPVIYFNSQQYDQIYDIYVRVKEIRPEADFNRFFKIVLLEREILQLNDQSKSWGLMKQYLKDKSIPKEDRILSNTDMLKLMKRIYKDIDVNILIDKINTESNENKLLFKNILLFWVREKVVFEKEKISDKILTKIKEVIDSTPKLNNYNEEWFNNEVVSKMGGK